MGCFSQAISQNPIFKNEILKNILQFIDISRNCKLNFLIILDEHSKNNFDVHGCVDGLTITEAKGLLKAIIR